MNYYQEMNGHLRLIALNLRDFRGYLKDVKNNNWPLSHVTTPKRYFRENNENREQKQYLSKGFIKKLWEEIT